MKNAFCNVKDRNKINYTVVCVNEFANRYGITSKEAFLYLDRFSGIDFIKKHYDVEHLLGFDEVVEDLATVCRNNGGVIDDTIPRK